MSKLKTENLTRSFGNLTAVSDVSLEFEQGKLHAVIGPNGAGKTTFFNLLTGMFPPSRGRIFLDGEDISEISPSERVRIGMGRTFQITEVFGELSLEQNIRIGALAAMGLQLRPFLSRQIANQIDDRVDELLELTGLTSSAARLVGELSHGDQRTAELAMALALDPRVLLLDEPTAGMGDQETYEISRLIQKLRNTGRFTILLIEHDMRLVFNLADNITVLAQGSVLASGSPKEISANEDVQTAYLGASA